MSEHHHNQGAPTAAGKDPADLCAHLEPLGHAERLRVLRRALLGELTGAQKLLKEWDDLERADRQHSPQRILTALRLAKDLETCRDLLNGSPVDPDRLDPQELYIAKNRRLVRLDMTAIDELEGQAA